MAIQVRGTFPGLVDNVDKVVMGLIGKSVKEITPIYPKFTKKVSIDTKFKRYVTSAPFGDIPEKPEGNPYSYDIIQQAYTKDVTPLEFGMGFRVTETAEEDDQYDELKKKAKYLTFSARQVEDKRAADVFNNGFSTVLTADAVALFSASHLLKRGGTAKNTLSTAADLSITSLGQAFIDLATDTKIESGQLGMPPTEYLLMVPPASEFIAHRVVKTSGLPGSADNDINPVKASRSITVVVNPFLTDTDAWFLIPSSSERHENLYIERRPITLQPPDTDPDTGDRLYKIRFRKCWDPIDWRNLFGTAGA